MPANFFARVSFALALLLVMSATSIVQAQTSEAHLVYMPLVQRTPTTIAGSWIGALTQAGNAYQYQLTLSTSGQQIQGSTTISDGTFFATMQITGAQFGSQYVIDETSISDTNGVPPGTRWCLKSLLLTFDSNDSSLLIGTWKQDGCNTGRVYLQRPQTSRTEVNGTWNGKLLQSTTTFSYTTSLIQTNANIQGISTISTATKSGTLRLKGFVVGAYVILQETEILQSNNQAWCLKTVEMKQNGISLEGTWSATGCVSGTVLLQRQ